MKRITGLHIIVGGTVFERTLELAYIADSEGAAVIQLREKSIAKDELLHRSMEIRKVTRNASFIVNDFADVAQASNADGVHLGQDDLPIEEARKVLGSEAIIGVSAPTVDLALEAQRKGADYIGFGHMFPTNSKLKTTAPQSFDTLRHVVSAVNIPVIAIGGITEENISKVLGPGLGGIAVIGAVRDSLNPQRTVRNIVRRLEEHHAAIA